MKPILLALLLATSALGAPGEGTTFFDTSFNTSLDPGALSNGQWWIIDWSNGGKVRLLNQDVNAQLLAGFVPGHLTPLVTLLLSDHTADWDITFLGDGKFFDQRGMESFVPGSVANGTAIMQVIAWTGHFDNPTAAMLGGGWVAFTPEFTQQLGGAGVPSPGLSSMPAIVLGIPEPGTVALTGVGALLLLLHRRSRVA